MSGGLADVETDEALRVAGVSAEDEEQLDRIRLTLFRACRTLYHPFPSSTMNRLFGSSSSSKPKPNLSDAIASTDQRIDSIEVKIRKLDAELTKFRDQMRKMRDGPGKVGPSPCLWIS
jgi:hypothetical protein